MPFCSKCGSQSDEGAQFCMSCGNPLAPAPVAAPAEQVTAPVSDTFAPAPQPASYAAPAPAPGSYVPPVVPPGTAPGIAASPAPKKSKTGLIITLVIVAVVVLGVLGGGLAFAMAKGYPWLPDNLTRKARAEASLEVMKALAGEDFKEISDLATGDLADQFKKNKEFLEEEGSESAKVRVKDEEWDGDELSCEMKSDDEDWQKIVIEPDDSSPDVTVTAKGEDEEVEFKLEYDEGWKVADIVVDGESFVDQLKQLSEMSDEGWEEEESEDESYDEDEDYSEEEGDEDEFTDDVDFEADECYSNQRTLEGAFQQALASGDYTEDDLTGEVDDFHLLYEDGYLRGTFECPTTGEYYYLYDDGTVESCSEHGYYEDADY